MTRRTHRRNIVGSILIGIALSAVGVLATGCTATDDQKAAAFDDQAKLPFTLTTNSGGKVECYFIYKDRGGGPTCDWVGYHNRVDPKRG